MSLGEITVLDYGGEPLTPGQEIHRVEGEETHFFFSPGSRWQPHLDHSCNHQGPSQERMPRSVQVSHPGRKCTFALFHRSYAEMNEEDTLYCSAHFQPSFPDIYFSLGLLSLCHTPLPHEWVAIKQYLFCFIATCIM